MDQFANLALDERDYAFESAASQLGLTKEVVEKDFWVCWSLKQLFNLPSFRKKMILKGGTSLSKVYDVIHRFSEDLDISLDRTLLGFDDERDPKHPQLSGNKRKAILRELQNEAEKVVSGPLFEKITEAFEDRLEQFFSLKVATDKQTLLFAYPTKSDNFGYIEPVVRFEFGARGVHLPAEIHEISPYVHKALPNYFSESSVEVKVLGIERTFWEKATILHMLAHQDDNKPLADRMSRHYYDMAMLINHYDTKSKATSDLTLLSEVAHHKAVFFKAAWAKYEDAKPGSLQLVPKPGLIEALREDYTETQEMIIGDDSPSFKEILNTINNFESEINS